MNTNDRARAVIFMRARVLSAAGHEPQAEQAQIEHQRRVCRANAVTLNADVVGEYVEHGGTGALEYRPVLRRMLDELVAVRDVKYVIVSGGDRLARSTKDWERIRLELEAAGAEVVVAGWGTTATNLAELMTVAASSTAQTRRS